MASQQPLSARGLSRTVLTPPDILGERMQLEQLGLRQDALRASQMAKQPTLKPYEFKEPNEYGDLFSSSRGKVADLIYNYFKDDIYALNPNNSQYYDPDKAQQARNLLAQANQLAALTKTQDKLWREVNSEQTPYELRAGRALEYMSNAVNMKDRLSVEDGVIMYEDPETGDKMPAVDAPMLQNPDYMKFIGADEFFDKEVPTIKENIESQLKNGDGSITTSRGKQDWIKERILYKLGTARNRDALVRDIVLNKMIKDGGYTDPEQIDPNAYEQLLEDEQYVERAIGEFADAKSRDIELKAGFSQTMQGDGGGFEINFGDAKKKFGGSMGQRSKTYFDGFNFFDVENEDAPLQWREEEHDVYTPRPGSIKMNIADGNVTVRADVRDIVKIKDDVLAVTYMYSPTRGVYNNDTIYLRKGDPEYESLKSGMEGYDPFQFINDWKSKTKGESVDSEKPKRGELD